MSKHSKPLRLAWRYIRYAEEERDPEKRIQYAGLAQKALPRLVFSHFKIRKRIALARLRTSELLYEPVIKEIKNNGFNLSFLNQPINIEAYFEMCSIIDGKNPRKRSRTC